MKTFWRSSNFWTALVMLVGGIWAAFPAQAGQDSINHVFGLVAAGKTLHEFFKESTIDVRAWLLDSNTFAYLGVVVTAVFGVPLTDELLMALRELVSQIFGGGNLQGILISGFAFATMLFNFIRGRSSLLPKLA